MIKRFLHKGLETFFRTGSTVGVQAGHAARLRMILTNLDAAESVADMDLTGLALHPLKGDRRSFWAVKVSGNWRVVFRFRGRDAELVDYLDYH